MKKGDTVPMGEMRGGDIFSVPAMNVRCLCMGRIVGGGGLACLSDEGVKIEFPPKHFDEQVIYCGREVDGTFAASPAPMVAGECPGPKASKLTRVTMGDLKPGDVFLYGVMRHIVRRFYDDAGRRMLTLTDGGDTHDFGPSSLCDSVIYCGRGMIATTIVLE